MRNVRKGELSQGGEVGVGTEEGHAFIGDGEHGGGQLNIQKTRERHMCDISSLCFCTLEIMKSALPRVSTTKTACCSKLLQDSMA